MKNIIFYFLFFIFLSSAQAQDRYAKLILNPGPVLSRIEVSKWKTPGQLPKLGCSIAFFVKPYWGIGLNYNFSRLILKDHERYWRNTPQRDFDETAYTVERHIYSRRFNFWDLPIYYRLLHKKHSLLVGLGASFRKDNQTIVEKELNWGRPDGEYVQQKNIGYCASISYQYSIFHNFGISADAVFCQSKDIPSTFSYGIGIFYQIWNKRKEKEKK